MNDRARENGTTAAAERLLRLAETVDSAEGFEVWADAADVRLVAQAALQPPSQRALDILKLAETEYRAICDAEIAERRRAEDEIVRLLRVLGRIAREAKAVADA